MSHLKINGRYRRLICNLNYGGKMSYNLNNEFLKNFWEGIFRFVGYLIGIFFLIAIIGYSCLGIWHFGKYFIGLF